MGRSKHQEIKGEKIEKEVAAGIRAGIKKKERKRDLFEEAARSQFLRHFDPAHKITGRGARVARNIFTGALDAAEKIDWDLGKAVKHISRGILLAVRELDGDFYIGAGMVVRSAVICAGERAEDAGAITCRAFDGVMGAARELDLDLDQVIRAVTQGALGAAEFACEEGENPIEKLVLSLHGGVGKDAVGLSCPPVEKRSKNKAAAGEDDRLAAAPSNTSGEEKP